MARRGLAGNGKTRQGKGFIIRVIRFTLGGARRGMARLGLASLGQAGRGEARLGVARQGKVLVSFQGMFFVRSKHEKGSL